MNRTGCLCPPTFFHRLNKLCGCLAIAMLAACGGGGSGGSGAPGSTAKPAVAAGQSPSPEVSITPLDSDFGTVLLGERSSGRVVVRNDGAADLDVTAMTLSGSGAPEFAIDGGGRPFTLSPGQHRDILLSFGPTASGPAAAMLEIASNDPDTPRQSIRLTGSGIDELPRGIVVQRELQTGGSTESADVTTSAPLAALPGELYLAAISSKPWRDVVAVSGLGLTWFPIGGQCAGRGQTGVSVWGAIGVPSSTDKVTASFDKAANSAALIVTRYSGVDTVEPLGKVVSANTNGLSGVCASGMDTSAYALDLNTTGAGSLVYAAAAMRSRDHEPGPGWTERAQARQGSGGEAASLAALDAVSEIQATTTVSGSFDGAVDWAVLAVEVRPDGSNAPPPDVRIEPAGLDYGMVLTGTSISRAFTVSNDGNEDMYFSAVSLGGPHAEAFAIDSAQAPFTLAPGATHEVVVDFMPSAAGSIAAFLRLHLGGEALIDIPLSSMAVDAPEPEISLEPASLDYGLVLINTSRTETFRVSNDGLEELNVQALRLTGVDAAHFTIEAGSAPFSVAPGTSAEVVVRFHPVSKGVAGAALEIDSDDLDEPRVDVALSGGGALSDDGAMATKGIWISKQELSKLPMRGPAWGAVKNAADGALGVPDIGSYLSDHDTRTLAVGLVYARTGGVSYRQKARDAIEAAIGTESSTRQAVQPCRNVVSYVITADLIDLASFDPAFDVTFRAWIDSIRYVVWSDGSMIDEDEERANNHGRMCGMSRAAIAAYLDDQAELDRTAEIFAGFLGDHSVYDGFLWKHDLSWQADERNPVGVNPLGAVKEGMSIDGALPEEMRRGGSLQTPPLQTGYPWEALQGILVEAVLLDRAGYDAFAWSDQAILRIVQFVERLETQFPADGWWASGDDTWIPWVINHTYGANFPTEPANIGKCMAWTDWTHAPRTR